MKEGKMSSKNERKKGLGRGLSSFLDVDGFDDIVEKKKDEDNGSDETNVELNESLLEDGVSLKTEEAISEEEKDEASAENKSPEQSGTE